MWNRRQLSAKASAEGSHLSPGGGLLSRCLPFLVAIYDEDLRLLRSAGVPEVQTDSVRRGARLQILHRGVPWADWIDDLHATRSMSTGRNLYRRQEIHCLELRRPTADAGACCRKLSKSCAEDPHSLHPDCHVRRRLAVATFLLKAHSLSQSCRVVALLAPCPRMKSFSA